MGWLQSNGLPEIASGSLKPDPSSLARLARLAIRQHLSPTWVYPLALFCEGLPGTTRAFETRKTNRTRIKTRLKTKLKAGLLPAHLFFFASGFFLSTSYRLPVRVRVRQESWMENPG